MCVEKPMEVHTHASVEGQIMYTLFLLMFLIWNNYVVMCYVLGD